MARAKTVTVTIRLPVGIVAILNDAVERGMFASTSDAVRSLVGRSLQVTSQDAVGGPMKGMGIGADSFAPSTMNSQNRNLRKYNENENDESNAQNEEGPTTQEELNRSAYWIYLDKDHYVMRRSYKQRGQSRWITHSN